MLGQGRPTLPSVMLLFALVSCCGHTALAIPPQPGAGDLADYASLTDVFFIDPDHGWAVGDQGAIQHTRDGGVHWYLQRSPVDCRLESVWFVDQNVGWAVGGWTHPYTHKTTGVVLRTQDSGRNWTLVDRHLLPRLKAVRFTDARNGTIVGVASPMYPSGIWTSTDGGRTFAPLPGGLGNGWVAADGHGAATLSLVGPHGQLASAEKGRLTRSQSPDLGIRRPRQVCLRGDGAGLLVGDNGLLLVSVDSGRQWHVPTHGPPPQLAKHFDFTTAQISGHQAWIAGTPGTFVFHTADGGESWQTHATQQNLPLHDLFFIDDRHGWAVGPLATILATDDAGRTWRSQLGHGTRVAALGLFGSAEAVPLAAVTQLSANDGYLTAIELLSSRRENVSPLADGAAGDRIREALVLSGASATGRQRQFPFPADGLELKGRDLIQSWDAATGADALPLVQQQLVRAIRQWRPDVVLTHAGETKDEDSLDTLLQQLVVHAVRDAADSRAATEQQKATGLGPWRVRRVYGFVGEKTDADLVLTTQQLVPRLGRSLAEQAAAGRALIDAAPSLSAGTLGFDSLLREGPRTAPSRHQNGTADFFHGIPLTPDGEARRSLGPPRATGMSVLRKRVQLRRNLEHLLANSANDGTSESARLGQIAQLARQLDADSATSLLHQLAVRHQHNGQTELAAETFQWLVDHYGHHPVSDAALVWLLRYYASGEMAWRLQQQSQVVIGQRTGRGAFAGPMTFVTPAGQERSLLNGGRFEDVAKGTVVPAGGTRTANDAARERARKALQFAQTIRGTRPGLAAEPAVALPAAAAERQMRRPAESQQICRQIVASGADDAWRRCARAELQANPTQGLPPKPTVHCVRSGQRPVLDGILDEPIWKSATPLQLVRVAQTRSVPGVVSHESKGRYDREPIAASARTGRSVRDNSLPAQVSLAHDQQYLYLAVQCNGARAGDAEPPKGPRPRDADLSAEDRVELLIDVDRDYATYYRLVVDHRGWTAESCFGDKKWDPKWYVAAKSDSQTWTIEAAIPLNQLVPQPPSRGDAWAIGLQRTIPGTAFQSWTKPASVDVQPQGFGLLIFD